MIRANLNMECFFYAWEGQNHMSCKFVTAISLSLLIQSCIAPFALATKPSPLAPLDKATVNSYLTKTSAYARAGDAKSVLKIQEFMIQHFPNEPAFYQMAGEAQSSLNNHQKAIELLDKAQNLLKTNPNPRFGIPGGKLPLCMARTKSYAKLKNYPKALENLNEAINLDTAGKYKMLYAVRGSINLELNKIAEAKKDFDKIKNADLDHLALYDAAILGSKLGYFEEAANLGKKAVAKKPEDPMYLGNCGYYFFELGRDSEANEFFKRAIATRKAHMNSYSDYAWLEKISGHIDEAEPHAKTAIELYPKTKREDSNDYNTFINGAIAYMVLNQFDEARKELTELKMQFPNCKEYYRQEGRILKAEGKLDQALEAYSKYLEKGEASRGFSERAAILKKLNRVDEAKKDLEKAKANGYLPADKEIAELSE